jgi:hypothetical protein
MITLPGTIAICQTTYYILMEPSEAQYLIINALETLDLLARQIYDMEQGIWYIETPSQVLPIAMILQDGEVVPTSWE